MSVVKRFNSLEEMNLLHQKYFENSHRHKMFILMHKQRPSLNRHWLNWGLTKK